MRHNDGAERLGLLIFLALIAKAQSLYSHHSVSTTELSRSPALQSRRTADIRDHAIGIA